MLPQGHELYLTLINGQVQTPDQLGQIVVKNHTGRNSHPHRRCLQRAKGGQTCLHDGDGQRKACGTAQY